MKSAQRYHDAQTPYDDNDEDALSAQHSTEEQFEFLYDRDIESLLEYAVDEGYLEQIEVDAPDTDMHPDYDLVAAGQSAGRVIHSESSQGSITRTVVDVIFDNDAEEVALKAVLREVFDKLYDSIFADLYDDMKSQEEKEFYDANAYD